MAEGEIPVPPAPTQPDVTPTVENPTEPATPQETPKPKEFDINDFMDELNADVAKEETAKMTSFQKAQDEKLTQVAKAVMEQSNEQVTKLAQIIENQSKQIKDLNAKYLETSDGSQAPLGQINNPFQEAKPQRANFNENDPNLKQAFFKKFNI